MSKINPQTFRGESHQVNNFEKSKKENKSTSVFKQLSGFFESFSPFRRTDSALHSQKSSLKFRPLSQISGQSNKPLPAEPLRHPSFISSMVLDKPEATQTIEAGKNQLFNDLTRATILIDDMPVSVMSGDCTSPCNDCESTIEKIDQALIAAGHNDATRKRVFNFLHQASGAIVIKTVKKSDMQICRSPTAAAIEQDAAAFRISAFSFAIDRGEKMYTLDTKSAVVTAYFRPFIKLDLEQQLIQMSQSSNREELYTKLDKSEFETSYEFVCEAPSDTCEVNIISDEVWPNMETLKAKKEAADAEQAEIESFQNIALD